MLDGSRKIIWLQAYELALSVELYRQVRAQSNLSALDRIREAPAHCSFAEETSSWRPDDWARSLIEKARVSFKETRNPMFAIEAYLFTRELDEPIPDWVLEFLDSSFAEMWASYTDFCHDRGSNNPERAFGRAFGLTRGRGQKTVWQEHVGPAWAEIAGAIIEYAWVIAEHCKPSEIFKETEAVKRFSRRARISFSEAWRLWARAKKEVPEILEEVNRARAARARAISSKR